MNLRKWLSLFIKTLLLGAGISLLVGALFQWEFLFTSFDVGEFSGFVITTVILGTLFSALSQMGFFAYLTLHRFGISLFRSHGLWANVQWLLIIIALFDLIYFRYTAFAEPNESLFMYTLPALFLLVFGLAVAYVKKKETNQYAFVPTLFLMTVVTAIEWIPVLKSQDLQWLWNMGITLVACNAYQVLRLHRLLNQKNGKQTKQTATR